MKTFIANTMLFAKERTELLCIHAFGLALSAIVLYVAPSLAAAVPFLLIVGAMTHGWIWKFTEFSKKPHEMVAHDRSIALGLYCFFFGLISLNIFMIGLSLGISFATVQYILLGYYVAARILPSAVGSATESTLNWLEETLAPTFKRLGAGWKAMWIWANKNAT